MVPLPTHHEHLDYATLTSLPLFAHLSPDILASILSEHVVRFYQDGESIFHQGDPAESLLIVLHGQVLIVTDGIFLVARQPYEVVGELAFLNGTMRNATVIAQGAVQVLLLQAPLVEHLMTDAAFTCHLLRLVAAKLDEATQERAFRFRQEALLFREFRAHLSAEVAQRLLATGKQYGSPRFIDAVLLFADIRSFTERSAGMHPEQLVEELQPFLETVVRVIHAHEGMIDKFIGDAVFALWGIAPTRGDPIQHAFACAQALLKTVARLSFGGAPLQLGIGLNAGRVFSGNVGTEEKRQFTVLGPAVNLAARYEGLTKELGAPVVMGEAFARRLPPDLFAHLRMHEQVAVRGAGVQTLFSYALEAGDDPDELE